MMLFFMPDFLPKFKAGEIVFNKQFQQIKKITKVELFNYRYCIVQRNQCLGDYYTRIRWFDKNHIRRK